MASKATIFNMALNLLGQDPIADPDGSGVPESALRQAYDICRKSLLEQHPWNFAIKRVALDKESEAPAMEYTAAFGLPSDCLRIIEVYNPTSSYKEEYGLILSDDSTMKIKYIRDEQDTSRFSALFTELLAYDIAIASEYKITNQQSLQQLLQTKRRELLIKAKMVDAQKDYNTKKLTNKSILAMDYPYGDITDY